jgi:hypothetical protein
MHFELKFWGEVADILNVEVKEKGMRIDGYPLEIFFALL